MLDDKLNSICRCTADILRRLFPITIIGAYHHDKSYKITIRSPYDNLDFEFMRNVMPFTLSISVNNGKSITSETCNFCIAGLLMLTVPRIRAPSYISVFERLIDAIAPMYNESLTDELQETMMKQFVYTPDNVFEIQSSLYGPEANVYIDTKYSKGKYLWSTWIGGNLVLSNTVTDTDSLDDYVTDVVIKIRDNIDAINDAYVLDND